MKGFSRRGFIQIKQYEDELPQALHKYVVNFYQDSSIYEQELQIENLRHLVSSRLDCSKDLRLICQDPLTMRMLFEVYHPDKIPENINIRLLFDQYWNHKVICDEDRNPFDSGSGVLGSFAKLKDDLCMNVAFRMFCEGSLLYSLSSAELSSEYLDPINSLISEGVFRSNQFGESSATEGITVEFFHQTFFEYSAARYIKAQMSDKKHRITYKMLEHIFSNIDDHFRIPILEQLAIIDKDARNIILDKLLHSKNTIIGKIAANIYAKLLPYEINEKYLELFMKQDKDVIAELIHLTQDFPSGRIDNILAIYTCFWERDWNIKAKILNAAIGVSMQYPHEILVWLQNMSIVSFINQMDNKIKGSIIDKHLLPILINILLTDSNWVLIQLEDIYKSNCRITKGLANIINQISQNIKVFNQESLLDWINTILPEIHSWEERESFARLYNSLSDDTIIKNCDYIFDLLINGNQMVRTTMATLIRVILCDRSDHPEQVFDIYFEKMMSYLSPVEYPLNITIRILHLICQDLLKTKNSRLIEQLKIKLSQSSTEFKLNIVDVFNKAGIIFEAEFIDLPRFTRNYSYIKIF
ncbi:MAG: hypothetical protein NTY22_04520 [Proteobacteria bacterium]|nr:hypothetical protein [Pseudomonadota bacterium]